MPPNHSLVTILPCNDLDMSEAFYNRLGFSRPDEDKPEKPEEDDYRVLSDGKGADIHLAKAVEGWLKPGSNPLGIYLYTENVDEVAENVRDAILEKNGPEDKPWGMYEFALSDPDQTLIRVGWPTRLRAPDEPPVAA